VSAITVHNVGKTYNPGKANEFVALSDISLEFVAGESVVLAGPSGSGKTTLLSLLGLMNRPTSGRITVMGRETTLLGEDFRTIFRRRHIGFIFQHFQLIGDLSVRDNLDVVLYPDGAPLKTICEKRARLLDRFGLAAKAGEKASVLSGGEQQRLAIARALMNDPQILLVDEPTAHLDTALSRNVIAVFQELKNEEKTVIVASHDPLVLDSSLAERVVRLRDGRMIGGDQ